MAFLAETGLANHDPIINMNFRFELSKTKPLFDRSPTINSVLIFVFIFIIILLFWLALPDRFLENESSDFRSFYSPVATNLLEGKGLITDNNKLAIRYPPGYPFILSVFYASADWASLGEQQSTRLLTLISISLSGVIIYWIAKEIWRGAWSLLAPLAWSTYPLLLWLTKQPNSEIPFLVFLYTAVYTFWLGLTRQKHLPIFFLISGLLLGFGMLIRPFAVGLPVLFVGILWFFKRRTSGKIRLRWTAVFLIGVLIFVLPWEIWLYQQTEKFYLLSSGGLPSVRDGITFAVNEKGYRESTTVPADVEMLMTDVLNLSQAGAIQSISDMAAYLGGEIGIRPFTIIKLVSIKAVRSWYATDSGRFELPALLLQIFYLIPLIWGSIVAWKAKSKARLLAIFIWLLVAYAWLMTTAVLSIYRYMLPVTSLLFVFIPGFFIDLSQRLPFNIKQTAT